MPVSSPTSKIIWHARFSRLIKMADFMQYQFSQGGCDCDNPETDDCAAICDATQTPMQQGGADQPSGVRQALYDRCSTLGMMLTLVLVVAAMVLLFTVYKAMYGEAKSKQWWGAVGTLSAVVVLFAGMEAVKTTHCGTKTSE